MNRRDFGKALGLAGIVCVVPATYLSRGRMRDMSVEFTGLDHVLLDLDQMQFLKIDAGGQDNMELYIDFWIPSDNRALEQTLMEALTAWSENYRTLKAKVIGWGFGQGVQASIKKACIEYPGYVVEQRSKYSGLLNCKPTIIKLTLLYEGEWNDA